MVIGLVIRVHVYNSEGLRIVNAKEPMDEGIENCSYYTRFIKVRSAQGVTTAHYHTPILT